jgi:hypothetical protein
MASADVTLFSKEGVGQSSLLGQTSFLIFDQTKLVEERPERLSLGATSAAGEEGRDRHVCRLTARTDVGFMTNKVRFRLGVM